MGGVKEKRGVRGEVGWGGGCEKEDVRGELST